MDRAFKSGASGTPPTAPVSPSVGYPISGNPGTGTLATKPGPWWYHMMTEEMRAVVVAAGITPDQTNTTQLRDAILALIAAGFTGTNQSLTSPGYQKLPGGLIIQWGSFLQTGTPLPANGFYSAANQSFPIAFPNACLWMGASSTLNYVIAQAVAVSASQFTPRFSSASAGPINIDLQWIAIGR